VAASPEGVGRPVALARGDYRWQMAVPADGILPFDGGFPALIQWEGALHPAQALPDSGVRLERLVIGHPEPKALRAALAGRLADPRVVIEQAEAKTMQAVFQTPSGRRVL
jgi:Glyoxalase-like domain